MSRNTAEPRTPSDTHRTTAMCRPAPAGSCVSNTRSNVGISRRQFPFVDRTTTENGSNATVAVSDNIHESGDGDREGRALWETSA